MTEANDVTWQHVAAVHVLKAVRPGWHGVWDALKSAISGKTRVVVDRDYVIEMMIGLKVHYVVDARSTATTEGLSKAAILYIDGLKIGGDSLVGK